MMREQNGCRNGHITMVSAGNKQKTDTHIFLEHEEHLAHYQGIESVVITSEHHI